MHDFQTFYNIEFEKNMKKLDGRQMMIKYGTI